MKWEFGVIVRSLSAMFGIGIAYQLSLQTQCRLSRFTEGFPCLRLSSPKSHQQAYAEEFPWRPPELGVG